MVCAYGLLKGKLLMVYNFIYGREVSCFFYRGFMCGVLALHDPPQCFSFLLVKYHAWFKVAGCTCS